MSDLFFGLTPDVVLAAVERGGLHPTGHCTPLNCLENRVYDIRLEDDRHVVIKFYRPGRWSRAAIAEEHAFLEDLDRAEVPVCAPLRFPDGETLHEFGGLLYAIWPRTGGRSPDELDDAEIDILGRLLARIHNVGAAAPAAERPRLDAGSRLRGPLALLEERAFLPPACARRYRSAALETARIYEERSAHVPVHRIHGDCHFGNLLHDGELWFFLDFDDFAVGPAVQDVWMLLPGRDGEGERQRRRLLDAYRQFRDFDDRWLSLVEPLRAMRFVWYAAWIARRIADPAFPDAFPHFGSEDYWERETRDLEEQLGVIERGPPGPPPGGADPVTQGEDRELTNEDFFWDL